MTSFLPDSIALSDSVPPPQSLAPKIRDHYNLLAPFYYLLWGEHVHHGYWENEADTAPPRIAQERILGELWRMAGCPSRVRLLDIGCGYAGPMLWLHRQTHVRRALGITISSVQQAVAQARIARAGLGQRARIVLADAQRPWPTDDGDSSLVWCFEMTEHLEDRAFWAQEAFRALEPGGTLCLAAWLAGERTDPASMQLRESVARDSVGYPFSTARQFEGWLQDAGFPREGMETRLITPHVVRTWEIAVEIGERAWIKRLRPYMGEDIEAYVRSFADLRDAFASGAMEYGLFVARKP
ncbi:MAG: methyltransferase domain-containing protein [Cytophagales bacterium]|nr:methyltransferase domain-containing protein [Armatimonadota bacterium]